MIWIAPTESDTRTETLENHALNAERQPTRTGKPWQPGTVHAILKRLTIIQSREAASARGSGYY
jgi:hypothetical protein